MRTFIQRDLLGIMHGKQSLDLFVSLNPIESLVTTLLQLKLLERHGSSVSPSWKIERNMIISQAVIC